MRLHKMHDLPSHCRKNHRAAESRQKGTDQGNDRIGCAPDHDLADRLDCERSDRHRQAADAIRQVAEAPANQNEADAEGRQAKPRVAQCR